MCRSGKTRAGGWARAASRAGSGDQRIHSHRFKALSSNLLLYTSLYPIYLRDFCHSKSASVRVLDYVMLPPTAEDAGVDAGAAVAAGAVAAGAVAGAAGAGAETISEAALYPQLVGPAHFTPQVGLCNMYHNNRHNNTPYTH
jgi:hypothetical protein